MSDTPLIERDHRWGLFISRVALLLGFMLLTSLSWGITIPVGNIVGLNINVQMQGYDEVSYQGEVIYKEKPVVYQVTVENKGNASVSGLEIQSSVHSDGIICGDKQVEPGSRLPGAAFSPLYKASLTPGQNYSYNAAYSPEICPSRGHIKVHVRYMDRGRVSTTSFLCPAHFRLQ